MAGQAQEPVTFEDVTVFLSRAEWDALPAGQQELYRDVVLDTYELLTSLGYPGPKPDILHRLERGEEPWICSSPEHAGSWLEEPSSGWWPGAGGYQGLETSCPGWGTLWCLQDRRFLKKSGCDEGRNEFSPKADTGVGSQTQPWLVKEEVQDKPDLTENLIQTETFLHHSVVEQQSLDPWEQPWERNPGENAQNHGHTLGETALPPKTCELRMEDLRAAVAKDHSYCLRGEPSPRRIPRPCSLREHDYCCQRRAGKSRGAHGGSATCAVCPRLARPRSGCGGTIRRAREILRRYRRMGVPWRGCPGCRGTSPGARGSRELQMNREIQSARNTQGAASDTRGAPEGILGTGASHSALSQAVGARKTAMPLKDPGASQESEGRVKAQKSQGMSLQDVFRDVLMAVGYILDSMCRKFELQGFSQRKNIWPIIIQIDNVEEIGKP